MENLERLLHNHPQLSSKIYSTGFGVMIMRIVDNLGNTYINPSNDRLLMVAATDIANLLIAMENIVK